MWHAIVDEIMECGGIAPPLKTVLIRVANDLLLSDLLLMLLDLRAAFDTFDHSILLNILESFH